MEKFSKEELEVAVNVFEAALEDEELMNCVTDALTNAAVEIISSTLAKIFGQE